MTDEKDEKFVTMPDHEKISAALVRSEFERFELEKKLEAETARGDLLRRDYLRAEAKLRNAAQDATGEVLWTYPDGQKCLKPYAEMRAAWIRTYVAYALPIITEQALDSASYKDIAHDASCLALEAWDAVQAALGLPNHAPTGEPTEE